MANRTYKRVSRGSLCWKKNPTAGTVCTRGTDTFSVLTHSFSPFVSHFDTHCLHLGDSPVLCGHVGAHKATVHMCKSRDLKAFLQLTRASTSVPVLCDSSTESNAWCSVFFPKHGTSSFQCLLTLFCSTLARSFIESRRRSSGLRLRPWL